MILGRGQIGRQVLLTESARKELARTLFVGQCDGLGWDLVLQNGKVIAMRHDRALAGYRSLIFINLQKSVLPCCKLDAFQSHEFAIANVPNEIETTCLR